MESEQGISNVRSPSAGREGVVQEICLFRRSAVRGGNIEENYYHIFGMMYLSEY